MYANEKQSFDDLKNPGDWKKTNFHQVDEIYGITLVCKCGDIISLSRKVHTLVFEPVLDVTPSIGHYNDDRQGFKCHYFIKNGEYIQS